VGNRCADHVTPLYPQKLALTSLTGGGRSVGIVRSRNKATEFNFLGRIFCDLHKAFNYVDHYIIKKKFAFEYHKFMTSAKRNIIFWKQNLQLFTIKYIFALSNNAMCFKTTLKSYLTEHSFYSLEEFYQFH